MIAPSFGFFQHEPESGFDFFIRRLDGVSPHQPIRSLAGSRRLKMRCGICSRPLISLSMPRRLAQTPYNFY